MNKTAFRIFVIILSVYLFPLLYGENTLEMRSAVFFHSSGRFREIYGSEGGCYQLEASTKLHYNMNGWANFDWFSKRGKSGEFNDSTRVRIANFSFGIKFPYSLSERFSPYIGLGPSFSRIWIKNKSSCVDHVHRSKWAIGGILKTGVYYFINQYVFIDFFVDYLYQPVDFETNVDIGGVKTGLGIGVKF